MLKYILDNYPNIYVTTSTLSYLPSENNMGSVEYKRNLTDCDANKLDGYATQMIWRINQNSNNKGAKYYIGVDDNGDLLGMTEEDTITAMEKFTTIVEMIDAKITTLNLIQIEDKYILLFCVRLKKVILPDLDIFQDY